MQLLAALCACGGRSSVHVRKTGIKNEPRSSECKQKRKLESLKKLIHVFLSS